MEMRYLASLEPPFSGFVLSLALMREARYRAIIVFHGIM